MEVSSNLTDKLIEFDGPWGYVEAHLIPETYQGRFEEEQLTWFKDNLMQLDDLELCLLEMEAGFEIKSGFCSLKKLGYDWSNHNDTTLLVSAPVKEVKLIKTIPNKRILPPQP